MQFAINEKKERVEARRGVSGACPVCGEVVIPKCGTIRVPHWAHLSGVECDSWYEPETAWHRNWKTLFPREQLEVVMGEHRADIVTSNGVVIELQNSTISAEEILVREAFYRKMVWVVHAEPFANRFFIMRSLKGSSFSFRWKQMRNCWLVARRPIYFDFGAVNAASLIGATLPTIGRVIDAEGRAKTFLKTRVGHLRDIVLEDRTLGYSSDCGLGSLHIDLEGCTMIRKSSLYGSGNGSGKPITREDFVRAFLADQTEF